MYTHYKIPPFICHNTAAEEEDRADGWKSGSEESTCTRMPVRSNIEIHQQLYKTVNDTEHKRTT